MHCQSPVPLLLSSTASPPLAQPGRRCRTGNASPASSGGDGGARAGRRRGRCQRRGPTGPARSGSGPPEARRSGRHRGEAPRGGRGGRARRARREEQSGRKGAGGWEKKGIHASLSLAARPSNVTHISLFSPHVRRFLPAGAASSGPLRPPGHVTMSAWRRPREWRARYALAGLGSWGGGSRPGDPRPRPRGDSARCGAGRAVPHTARVGARPHRRGVSKRYAQRAVWPESGVGGGGGRRWVPGHTPRTSVVGKGSQYRRETSARAAHLQ